MAGWPCFRAVYVGVPGLLVGFIAQNPVSFAYTSSNRLPQNTLQIQPVFAFHLWDRWYLRSAEATWMMGMAPTFADDPTAEFGNRANACASRAASDELLRYRTMDGLSAVCASRAPDHD
jgi:hypothetical protein